MISVSGLFAVTFSVVLAYVADITTEENRSWAYGMVSATFAASLVSSPAIGAVLGKIYSENFVVALATSIALLDILFILIFVPESLPEKMRFGSSDILPTQNKPNSRVDEDPFSEAVGEEQLINEEFAISSINAPKFNWEKVDPFRVLKKMCQDKFIMLVCIVTFLSYLPEAGQYSCFFIYLRLVMGFSEEDVAMFIALTGILSCLSQTIGLTFFINWFGLKSSIIIGLLLEALQLAIYGFSNAHFFLWTAGCIAGVGSITYPALSSFLSYHVTPEQQGVAQGLITGIRGLCSGLGPAVYGLIFYMFQVDLNVSDAAKNLPVIHLDKPILLSPEVHTALPQLKPDMLVSSNLTWIKTLHSMHERFIPGPPFAFGSLIVILATLVAFFIPKNPHQQVSVSVAQVARFSIHNLLKRFRQSEPSNSFFIGSLF
ncbi:Hippocampus abundant transcript 1 protein [Cichlidogyrus casuarinus]|uniref:Hippocampus abundant transcript 1 protein n=1 Tax=Cichlidogyrus casuarinus TaxID=1844966 RepID=A0ABD2Q5I6_9PLAT